MSDRIYTSATQRLSTLPEVFTGSDLTIVFGWKSAVASTYLALWRKAGLVKSLGGRSDVHMNLVQNRRVNPEHALRRAYPRAIKVGVDVLRQAGWTTQIPWVVDVVVPKASGLHGIEGFHLQHRSDKWFDSVSGGLQKVTLGIDQLQPAWALADMLARARDRRVHDAMLLDPDDLDLDAVFAEDSLQQAMAVMGVAMHGPDDYEALYSAWSHTKFQGSRQVKTKGNL